MGIGPNVIDVSVPTLSVRVRARGRPAGNTTGEGEEGVGEETATGTVPARDLLWTCGCLGGSGIPPLWLLATGLERTELPPFDMGESDDSGLPVDWVERECRVDLDWVERDGADEWVL